jgi:hypothetical protein
MLCVNVIKIFGAEAKASAPNRLIFLNLMAVTQSMVTVNSTHIKKPKY